MTLLAVFSLLIVTMLYTLFSHVMHQEYKYMAKNSLVSADSVLLNSYDKLSGVINEGPELKQSFSLLSPR